MLDDGLEASKLIFGGRRLSPVSAAALHYREIGNVSTTIGETVFGALQKVKDAAVDDDASR